MLPLFTLTAIGFRKKRALKSDTRSSNLHHIQHNFVKGNSYIVNVRLKQEASSGTSLIIRPHYLKARFWHRTTQATPKPAHLTIPKAMATEPMDTTSATKATTSPTPKSKRSHSIPQPTTKSLTLRNPTWSYIHLRHQPSPSQLPPNPLDALTAHIQITAALHQFLGVHGAAVPVDILRLDASDVWIRVPAGDRSAVVAAVGGWVGRGGEGWRVIGWSSWSAGAEGGRDGGRELFGN